MTNTSTRNHVAELVMKARKAQAILDGYSQEQVDLIAAAVVFHLSRPDLATRVAEMAYEETKMGLVESKRAKLTQKMPAIFHDIRNEKTVGVIDRDEESGITTIAKPFGVIAALVPSTNCEATPIFKSVLGIRARNAVICAPHPVSKTTTQFVVNVIRAILRSLDAPEDLVQCIDTPSKALAGELMAQCDLTMATGSSDMVKAAYSSGRPAYGVGVGNAAVIIDETVNLEETAAKISIGKTGDNASGCSAENSIIVHASIYDDFLNALKAQGAYIATMEDKEKLQAVMWENGHVSRKVVARPVGEIATLAEMELPTDRSFIVVEESGAGPDFPFSGEKLSLVLTCYKYERFEEAVALVNKITDYSGSGHSCGIHSNDINRILKLGLETRTSRVIVRQPHGVANSGSWSNGLAKTFSLGCGSWGGNSVSENVTQKHYYNTTRIAEPLEHTVPDDTAIYGQLLDKIPDLHIATEE
ncbi:aldehyde dehydrogenase family protein [Franzmannia qiaohouensis]|uniref:Aldehyde dehydrogenase family protein n=1 Tax=Franzmannia qiaohouensis TaxID=1329370 RepID=A0ABU1HLW0_9GAMM|nr:aldehyde dehydrogenase family protein [Halomonas qiaohouensis]MDR5907754.1 aldehyde dehydrogenase family protein [Halomonas qiaohouensis]